MSNNQVIVTGGAGFLGRHLCRALDKAGYQVKVIDLVENQEFPSVQADVRDVERMLGEITQAQAVFHLASLIEAGESVEKPAHYIDYNVAGTLSVLEAMQANNISTFLFSSSAAIYGEPMRVPIKEDDRTLPINPYGMTKLAMEGFLSSFVANHGFTGVALRYFNLYGPEEHHQPETHAIPRFINQIENEEEVTVWGDGHHQRDFVYIDDVVEAHLLALDYALSNREQYHYCNLSTQKAISVLEIIQKLEKLMGRKAKIKHHSPRPGDPLVLVADASKAHEMLGWQAKTDFDEGLRQTVEYYQRF